MAMEDTESCSSRAVDSLPSSSRKQRQKAQVYNDVRRRLKDSNNTEASRPGFDDELWAHFYRLPTRYAMDVNVERAEDVLMHKRLLRMANDPANRPALEVRLVQVHSIYNGNCGDSNHSNSPRKVDALSSDSPSRQSHPPPAFGMSLNLELAVEGNKSYIQDGESSANANAYFFR